MFIKKKSIFSFLILLAVFFSIVQLILVQNIPIAQATQNNLWQKQEGLGDAGVIGKEFGAAGTPADVRVIAAGIIEGFLGLLGIIFLTIIVIAGFHWMTAQGSEEKITAAKNQLRAGIIGLIIIITAYALTEFILKELSSAVKL